MCDNNYVALFEFDLANAVELEPIESAWYFIIGGGVAVLVRGE